MQTKELESDQIEHLHAAARDVFETMVNLQPGSVERIESDLGGMHADVVGTLGFTGTKSGILIISASLELARVCCASMLFMDPSEIEGNQDISDSFGEIVNMITGGFKNSWVEKGNVMDLAIPTVAIGDSLSIGISKDKDNIWHSSIMEFEQGKLRIDLCFHD